MGIKLRVGEPKFTPLDESKWYPARIVAITEDVMEYRGKPSDKWRFDFVILDPADFEGRECDGIVNQPKGDVTERHTLYQWLTVLLGGVPPSVGDEIDFPDQFIGEIVYVKLKSKTKSYEGKDPMTFQNVDKIAICPPNDKAIYADRAPLPSRDDAGPSGSSPTGPVDASGSPQPGSPDASTASPGSPGPDAATGQSVAGGAAKPSPTTQGSPTPTGPTEPTPTKPPESKATVDVPGKGKRSIPF